MCTNYRTNFENQQEYYRLRSGIVKNIEQFFFSSSETSAASICEISAFGSLESENFEFWQKIRSLTIF